MSFHTPLKQDGLVIALERLIKLNFEQSKTLLFSLDCFLWMLSFDSYLPFFNGSVGKVLVAFCEHIHFVFSSFIFIQIIKKIQSTTGHIRTSSTYSIILETFSSTFNLTNTNAGSRAYHILSQALVTTSMIPSKSSLQNTENSE
jgi:hypothetical protein